MRVTFLTGASSGLGYSLARLLADDGDAVALAARRESELAALAQQITDNGGKALPISCDVSDRNSVRSAVDAVQAKLGPIDCLIANAGIGGVTAPQNFDGLLVQRILQTNLIGAAYCIEAVLPRMIERRSGHIVGISSLASFRGLPYSAAYCASKSGLNALLESLRVGLRPYNVAVTTICPGFVHTPMTAGNRNPMPFVLEQEDAARRMFNAIRKRKRMYSFPWQLAFMMKAARLMPDALYDRAFERAKLRKAD